MAGIVVVALALALRVGWVLLVPTRPVGDFAMYLESTAHLVEFGSFDPEYVYMPGYIFLLAPVRALGGGWLAAKLVGALLGGLASGAMWGIARRIWNTRVALVAGLLCALWPAGIALASVTGTDMPAAALIAIATWALLRFSPERPRLAAVLFGLVMGLATYIRAVALPLTLLAVLPLRASGLPWRRALRATALACVLCAAVLSPWIVRNRLRYGETFATDSHGGLTALVGANPNTDGCYSRSLNLMFHDATGFTLLAEPHREADHTAMGIARQWTAFDPAFSLGMVLGKAERLLSRERALLYWPLFRIGVLPPGHARWFGHWRSAIETVADTYWSLVLVAALVGLGVACHRRLWLALSLVPLMVGLGALYALIFAEPRYRLPITLLLMVPAGAGLVWLGELVMALIRRQILAKREIVIAVTTAVVVLGAARTLAWAGTELRDRNRWAVHLCDIAGQRQLCAWRAVRRAGSPSGLRGVIDGWGLDLQGETDLELDLAVPSGAYELRADFETRPAVTAGQVELRAAENRVSQALAEPGELALPLSHAGGQLHVQIHVAAPPGRSRLWLKNLRLAGR